MSYQVYDRADPMVQRRALRSDTSTSLVAYLADAAGS